MPKTKRDILKRKLAQSYNLLDTSLEYLRELEEIFRPVHPEYADFLVLIAQNIIVTQEFMMQFWEKAWGKRPRDIDAWRM